MRDAPITIKPDRETYQIPVFGDETITVGIDSDGGFQGTYRKERLWGNADSIRKAVQQAEQDATAKKERSKRLKEAEAEPVPAMLYVPLREAQPARRARSRYGSPGEMIPAQPECPARFERVGIRGIDQRSGNALVVRADGSRESLRWDHLVRPLTAEQQKKLLDLLDAHRQAKQAVPMPDRFGDVAENLAPMEITATYDGDPEVEGWLVQHDGQTFFSDRYRPFQDLARMVAAHEIAKTYPWAESHDEVVSLVELAAEDSYLDSTEIFKTREDGEAYIAAGQRVQDAWRKFEVVFASVRFDKKRFAE